MEKEIKRTKEYLDGKVMQTFLFTAYGNFYVSTAYREDYNYFETFGWKLDKDNQKIAGTLMDATRGSSSRKVGIEQHYEVCNSLQKDGTYSYDNRNDVLIKF